MHLIIERSWQSYWPWAYAAPSRFWAPRTGRRTRATLPRGWPAGRASEKPLAAAVECSPRVGDAAVAGLPHRAAGHGAIEMLKLVPLPPYRVDIFDVLQIRVIDTLLDQPIDSYFLVEAEGIVPGARLREGAGGGDDHRGGDRTQSRRKLTEMLSSRRSRCSWPGRPASRRSPASTSSGPTARSICGIMAWCHVTGKTMTEARRPCRSTLAKYFESPESRSR